MDDWRAFLGGVTPCVAGWEWATLPVSCTGNLGAGIPSNPAAVSSSRASVDGYTIEFGLSDYRCAAARCATGPTSCLVRGVGCTLHDSG